MPHLKPLHRLLLTAALALSTAPSLAASTIEFKLSNPEKVIFSYSDFELFDDYVNLTTTGDQVPTAAAESGDTITWDYKYAKQFRVNSDDKADIKLLKLFARGNGSDKVDIKFWLTDGNGDKIPSTTLTWTDVSLKANVNLILFGDLLSPSGDEKLGVLKGRTVGDFHLEMQVKEGEVTFAGGSFNWTVDDITAIPEPTSSVLVSLGLLTFGLARRQN